ncbi:hypothetical protein EVA_08034, partial [gut metagenome]
WAYLSKESIAETLQTAPYFHFSGTIFVNIA